MDSDDDDDEGSAAHSLHDSRRSLQSRRSVEHDSRRSIGAGGSSSGGFINMPTFKAQRESEVRIGRDIRC